MPSYNLIRIPHAKPALPAAVLAVLLNASPLVKAQALTPQGYSGVHLIPSASTLTRGAASVAYGNGVPGAARTSGHTLSAGFGLTDTLEFSATLATNSWNCNFYLESCPGPQLRDLSSGFKWSPQIETLNRLGWQVAVGTKDPGGAANNFKSFYAVAGHTGNWFSTTLGYGYAPNQRAPLHGLLINLTTHLPWGIDAGIQKAGDAQLAHLNWTSKPLGSQGIQWRVGAYRSLGSATNLPKDGFEVSTILPMQSARNQKAATDGSPVRLARIPKSELQMALTSVGIHRYQLYRSRETGGMTLIAENTAFHESPMDAAGAAMAILAAVHRDEETALTVLITHRGLPVVSVRASSACYARWLEDADRCPEGYEIVSYPTRKPLQDAELIAEGTRDWLRPEVIFSPNLSSTLGTEVGSLDVDLGINANLVMPLWRGAVLDFNRIIPTRIRTDDFKELSGAFWAQQHVPGFDRKMIHQLLRWDRARTTVRLSAGSMFKKWEGGQAELQTVSPEGTHRFSAIWGKFQHPVFVRQNRREYAQFAYRYSWDERHTQTTQLQVGEFWNGDRGYQLTHRFWFGERNVALHVRQSRFTTQQPAAMFAGLSVTVPLTPATNRGWTYGGVRGTTAFGYGYETQLRNSANLVTGGYGAFPATGEGIGQIFNRDRVGDAYFYTQAWRLRESARWVRNTLEN